MHLDLDWPYEEDVCFSPSQSLDNFLSQFSLPTLQQKWKDSGMVQIKQFLAPQIVHDLLQELQQYQHHKYTHTLTGNAYLRTGDPTLAEDHALNLQEHTTLAVMAYDLIPKNSLIHRIYKHPGLGRLVQEILELQQIYYYNCPLGAVNLAIMTEGHYLRWHYDQSDFVVSILLQNADTGGEFQYVHRLRNAENDNYEGTKAVIQGQHALVQTPQIEPGDLLIFEGRYTLHRVTPIEGLTPRVVLLLGLADRPGVTSDDYLRKIRYGRTQ